MHKLCFLPVGSYEQHGPHLPPSVDTEIAVYASSKLAEREGGIVLPPVWYTCSREHSGFPNTIWISCSTFTRYMEEVLRSALDFCERVIVIAGHGGNSRAGSALASQLNYELGARILWLNFWSHARIRDHAGTDETSAYLAIGGKLIGELVDVCEGDIEYLDYAPVRYYSRSGVVGCLKPSEISAERGARIIERAIESMEIKIKKFKYGSASPSA